VKQTLPLVITFVLGFLFVVEFFIPAHGIHEVTLLLQEWGSVITAFAFILGGINMMQANLPKIWRREQDWIYKIVLVGSALVMLGFGLYEGQEGRAFLYLYNNVFAPCNSTMFALLAFFITSAAFRAFRARNLEALLMLATAVVVMLCVVPLGELFALAFPTRMQASIAEIPSNVKDWILDYANNAGRRAIMIGAALGAVATGLRVILGLERSHLGGD
jgi:hypothetical protein